MALNLNGSKLRPLMALNASNPSNLVLKIDTGNWQSKTSSGYMSTFSYYTSMDNFFSVLEDDQPSDHSRGFSSLFTQFLTQKTKISHYYSLLLRGDSIFVDKRNLCLNIGILYSNAKP